MDPFRLDGEIALITGGGTGLGLGIARCMVAAGAKVVLAGRTESTLKQACDQLGPASSFEVFDVTHFDEAPALADRVRQRHGKVSLLVNNAGLHLKKMAVDTTEEEVQHVLDTHVLGALALTRACAPAMLEARAGSIVFIASMSSFIGVPKVIAYAAAKAALVGVVRTLASEFSPQSVRVNAIAPGWIETDMLHQALAADPQRKNRILDRTPMQRFGTTDDIGHAAVYLCSPAANFVTGSILVVDGGASVGF